MKEKILVIDDEEAVCEILKYNLESAGYSVDVAYSAEEACDMPVQCYDLLIVDIMMGDMSGLDLAEALRQKAATAAVPVIFCSALDKEDDKVRGLNIGADDYIAKPFDIGEVLARVRAVLRRSSSTAKSNITTLNGEAMVYGRLRIDTLAKRASIDGVDLQLTEIEYTLLQFLMARPNKLYTREEIAARLWTGDITLRAIDTNVTRLRKKLGDYGGNIITVQGIGYGFRETD